MRIVVIGCGVAGMGASLLLGRAGHDVILIDRDPQALEDHPDVTFEAAARATVPQFKQPHNFLGLGRQLLRDHLPDVYRTLLEVGAGEFDQVAFLPEVYRFFILNYVVREGARFFREDLCTQFRRDAVRTYLAALDVLDVSPLLR